VEDVEATVTRALELEADLIMPPMTMKEGSFAVLQDPTGAVLGLWQAGEHLGAGWVNDARGFCWNELYTPDVYLARSFYEQLFDWEFERSGPGERAYWTIKNRGRPIGGMMKIREELGPVPPSWSVYFAVESCSDSLAKAEFLGASVFLSPMKLPKIGTFAGIEDPQGGHFLIMEMVAKNEVP
jgi:predicted enzyme related to lactoylglutathione lyase